MQDVKKTEETLLPVSLLCGFLGAGKTTLLKHVLETKHAEEDFKCAVIVNDMAALNIDKSLIDQSSLVQSDKVIKAPLNTKLTLMDCGIGNTNLLESSSSGLGYDCFYMKSTDGATMYFNLGSGIGSGRFQTDYWVKSREKDEK